MNSAAVRMCGLSEFIRESCVRPSPDAEKTEERIRQVRLKYHTYEEEDCVAKGDIVTLEMESPVKRYNRTVSVNTSFGLFDREIEEDLPGRKKGESYLFHKTDGTEIFCTVQRVSRPVVPELTDEMARKEETEGVSSAAELTAYYERQSVLEKARDLAYGAADTYLARCEFSVEEEEIAFLCARETERCRGIARSMGMNFDEMSPEQLGGAVGCASMEQFQAMIREYYGKVIRGALAELSLRGAGSGEVKTEEAADLYYALLNRIAEGIADEGKETAAK